MVGRKPRFSLKLMLVFVLAAAVALAIYVRPSYYATATIGLQANPKVKTNIRGEMRPTCAALLRSPLVIGDAVNASPKVAELLQNEAYPLQWISDRIDLIPVGEQGIEIRLRGEPADKQKLESILRALLDHFAKFLAESTNVTPGVAAWSVDPDFEINSGWGPTRQ